MSIKSEDDMAESVKRGLLRARVSSPIKCDLATTELELESGRFDVVGYNQSEKTFVLVECKLDDSNTSIGQAFGQILTYKYIVSRYGYDFFKKFDEKLKKEGLSLKIDDVIQAYKEGVVNFRFYVALSQSACKNYKLIHALKDDLKLKVGVIRVRNNGSCLLHIHTAGNKEDKEICESDQIPVTILRSYENMAKFFEALEHKLRNQLRSTPYKNFKTNENTRSYKQFWIKSSPMHFEVLLKKRKKEIEIAFHLESTKKKNYKLLKHIETYRRKITNSLGKVELGKWSRSWARIYELIQWGGSEEDLNEDLLDKISQRMYLFITTLQPILGEFEK